MRVHVRPTPKAVYRYAVSHGWTDTQAAEWAAWTAGLDVMVRHPWTFAEVQRLMFLRWAYEHGRLAE